MVIDPLLKAFRKLFGTRNDRLLKYYRRKVEQINVLEPEMRGLTDAELRARTAQFRRRIEEGEKTAALLPEMMAVAREVMDRAVGIRNILNPAEAFDPSTLPPAARADYDRVKAEADAKEPVKVLGSQRVLHEWLGKPDFNMDESDVLVPGWMQVEIPASLYEAVRALHPQSRPPFRARPFDVQLIGGMVLGEGKIAEMKTGEGKTIVAPLACYVACVDGLQCHVVTTNDYLVQRDRDWVFPFYHWLGLTVGAIHPIHMQPPPKKAEAYQCDVLYATNSELGFDYLRDNMKLRANEQLQKRRDFCIVDEIDSILIDEARTPLIISGPAHDDAPKYDIADKIARHLVQLQREWDAKDQKVQQTEVKIKGLEGDIRNSRDKTKIAEMRGEMKRLQDDLPGLEQERDQHTQYYELEPERKAAHLTHDGIAEAQKQAGVGSFFVGNNMDMPHLLENALRAHAVYKRDKDYVVREGEVIIVDEFTGRLMIGRQWSDGLHQAVEAKESVKIKQETQTLATVTIQNFFKLYKRLAGMTGTAVTESTEFGEIYSLEVVCIPTNVPVIRVDREDLIYLGEKDKWGAIVDEIKRVHDLGRPVLVGTTSVEKSEVLSQMLTKKYGIQHEVLNAKVDQAERESLIVENAGELGAVMIATNMAGRGTDIKLRAVDRDALVRHWQVRNLLPRQAKPEMSDDELVVLSYRHQAEQTLDMSRKEIEQLSDDEVKLRLLRHWVEQDTFISPEKLRKMSAEQCVAELDRLPDYTRHRLSIWPHTQEMGGLHIVGTERHESRRIDNQLRGRSGRQGDRGSSRFFISLEDDLMKFFAGNKTKYILSKLGMKEGMAIEHRMVSRSVEKAQRKVEERNYEIRKSLLEYDEVMEYQRNAFYGIRQEVLEGRNVSRVIFDYIEESVGDAVATYKDDEYVQTQVAEWCRQTLDVSIEPGRLRLDDFNELKQIIRGAARNEIGQTIDVTLGEYMSSDLPPDEWDLRGLRDWAMRTFNVDLKMGRVREMSIDEVRGRLIEAAHEQLERKDLDGVQKFLDPAYAERELASWARNKFGIELDPQQLAKLTADQAVDQILEQAHNAYRRREVTYPVDFILELVFQGAQQDQQWAVGQLLSWVRQRFEIEWTPEEVTSKNGQELRNILVEQSEAWLSGGGKLEQQVAEQLERHRDDRDALAEWFEHRFAAKLDLSRLNGEVDAIDEIVHEQARSAMRSELTQLERFVLLQILDQAWKDHLYGMDQLKDSVGLRGYAEKDPRIEYKREGANHFQEMQRIVRDRVTDLIFRAKLTPNVQLRSVYAKQEARHEEAGPAVGAGAARQPATAAAAAQQGTQQQRADLAAAEQAGSHGRGGGAPMSRKQRRAAEARERKTKGRSQKQRKRKSR